MAQSFQPTTRFPVRARRAGQVGKYTCSICRIDYEPDLSTCPMCDVQDQLESVRQELLLLAQEKGHVEDDLKRARAQVEYISAMRESIELMAPEDLAMIKAFAYMWRSDPSGVAVVAERFGHNGESPKPTKDGKIALRLRGTGARKVQETHVPASIGGVVFAESYQMLCRAQGRAQAMGQYAEAIAEHLTAEEQP